MSMDVINRGVTSGNGAEVDTANQLKVVTGLVNDLAGTYDPTEVGAIRIFSEIDSGFKTGVAKLMSPDVDEDYRLRISQDTILDHESFTYTAQNTGKHTLANTTLTGVFTNGNFTTNGGSVTTTATGVTFGTYAMFPMLGAHSIFCEVEAAFSNQPQTNVIIDFGMFQRGASTAYAPLDGAYFRLNATGLQGVINHNGTEVTTSNFAFTYTNNKKYQFIIAITPRKTMFWVEESGALVLLGEIETPDANAMPFMSASLPFSIRHAHVGGAAGGIIQFQMGSYNVTMGGSVFATTLGDTGNRIHGSHQGLSGGTMGSLANYANSANPTAAVATNTTAALGTGLGGQFWETATIAVNTDGIISSYQVPAGSATAQGRRLKIKGVALNSYIQTALTGGPCIVQWSLAFGHTAVSLATAEAATTKAPRRIALPFTQVLTAGQAVSTLVSQVEQTFSFDEPIYVNPGEFVAMVAKKVGTAITAGVIAHVITFDYSWE